MPWRCGFRVLCAFSVLVLLLRQTGNGKLARWRQRFQSFEEYRGQNFISAKHLTNLFNKPFAAYLVTSAQIEPLFRIGPDFYVGSTTVSVQKRQDSRLRKLRQLLGFKPVHAELMLHWQVSHHGLGSLIAIPLATMNTSRQIRTLESTLIQKWNPTLNYPFILKKRITKLGPDYSRSVRQIASSYSAPGNRLHRKLRARLHKMGALSLYSTEKQEVHSSWMILKQYLQRSPLLLLICNGDFDQARTRYLIFMHLSGCQTTWKSLPRAWCKASCLESLLSKEVSLHQKRDPSRYLFCLTTISGTPPRSGSQTK